MPEIKKQLPPQDIEKMTKVVNMMQEIYAERGDIPFLIFVSFIDKRSGAEQFKVFPGDAVPSYIMREFVQHMVHKKDATSIITTGEGWVVEVKVPKGEKADLGGLRPSQHPNRKSMIFFTYENKESYWIGRCTSDKDGVFSEIEWEDSEETGGHFGNMFPGKKVLDPHDLKAKDDNDSKG